MIKNILNELEFVFNQIEFSYKNVTEVINNYELKKLAN